MAERELQRFGPFELDVRSRELRTGTACIRLQEQPFEILRLMLERPGEVVTRDVAGDAARALAYCRRTTDIDPDYLPAWRIMGAVYLQEGRAADGLRLLEAAYGRARHDPICIAALAHVGLGDRDAAFALLEQAVADCDPALANLAVEPHLEPLRADARYTRLLERLRLA